MGYRAALLNFSKGEIAPEVRARFDLSAYQAAAARAYNVKIRRTGGLYKRQGTRFVAEAMSSGSHFFTFQFNDEQAYGLEMAQEKMRPIALGGMILEEGLKVLSISQEGQAVFQVAWHDYVVGDVIYFDSIEGMTEVNDRFITVIEVIDVHHFRTDFDSSQAAAFITDTDESIARAGPPTPPPVPPPTPTPTPTPTPPVVTTGGGRGDDFHNRFDT